MDIVLLGIHPNTPRGCDSQTYTGLLCDAMRNNPFIDLIVHLDDPNYPVDFRQVADCAARLGMAVEINNSKTLHHRTSPERTVELITACMQAECSIAVTSDTHAITELGRDDAVLPYLQSCSVPAKQVITREKRSALDFLQSRKALKQQITHNIVGFFCMGM
jgi:putative hydrolase